MPPPVSSIAADQLNSRAAKASFTTWWCAVTDDPTTGTFGRAELIDSRDAAGDDRPGIRAKLVKGIRGRQNAQV